MTTKVFIGGREVDAEQLNLKKEPLSEIRIKKLFKDGIALLIQTSKYRVGKSEFPLGLLQIDASCEVQVTEDAIEATVYYPLPEFASLLKEEGASEIERNGMKFAKAKATVKKGDILLANAFKSI